MWSRESVSLLAGEISNFIPEIYPCYSHRLFIFNLKNNQNANTEYKLLNDVKGQEQGGRDGNRKKKDSENKLTKRAFQNTFFF